MDTGFKDWLDEAPRIEDPLVEGMVKLHLRMKKYWEAGGMPITIPRGPGSMDMALKYPGRHLDAVLPKAAPGEDRVIKGPDSNFLVPVDSLLPPGPDGKSPKGMSHFVRDMPYIGAFAQSSPENMASAIIFVLLTIRADFMQVMATFPVVMSTLMSKFGNTPITADVLVQTMFDMEGKLAAASKPGVRKTNDGGKTIRQGYGTGGELFDAKFKGVSYIWNNRKSFYDQCMNFVAKKDTVGVFKFIATNVKGIAQPKAGFCVQLIFGELGCIDMHNVNLYSQYYLNRGQPKSRSQTFQPDTMVAGNRSVAAPGARDMQMYNALDPGKFSASMPVPGPVPGAGASATQVKQYQKRSDKLDGTLKAYVDILKDLEKDGFNTIKLWDIWVSYVSKYYVKKNGESRYARDGRLAGNPMDPENDDVDRRIMQTRDIPDRNAVLTKKNKTIWKPGEDGFLAPHAKGGKENPYPTGRVDGMDQEDSAGAASLSHGAIHWWRNPDYWWDLVHQADGKRAKDGVRYAADKWTGPGSDIPKPLAYIDNNPDMLHSLFPDDQERREFEGALKDVIKKHDFYGQDNPRAISKNSRYGKNKHPKQDSGDRQSQFDF